MFFTVNAFRFSLINRDHEMASLALKLKYVAHRLVFLDQIIVDNHACILGSLNLFTRLKTPPKYTRNLQNDVDKSA